MGNDGGVIAVQRKFMRHGNTSNTSSSKSNDPSSLAATKVTTCTLSTSPLEPPIVVDALGQLYNKKTLIERLLERTMPVELSHVTSLKDVVTVTAEYPVKKEASDKPRMFVCPLTQVEMNGQTPFRLMLPCGCLLATKALRAMDQKDKEKVCHVCGKPRTDDWAISPAPEELATLKASLVLKKKKKKKKRKTERGAHNTSSSNKRKKKVETEAIERVEAEKKKSEVYNSLFVSNDEKDKTSANDLLMTIGGLRYTLS